MSATLDDNFSSVLRALGYSSDPGLVRAAGFGTLANHRLALAQAAARMKVAAAFGLWSGPEGAFASAPLRRRFTPLVYIAQASSDAEAVEIHCGVWNQGLVPYLLVVTESGVWLCNGFAFDRIRWRVQNHFVSVSELTSIPRTSPKSYLSKLRPLEPKRLRSSLGWRDYANWKLYSVDNRLLESLAALSISHYANGQRDGLSLAAANAVIGRLLYIYFLVDRGLVTQKLLRTWNLPSIKLEDATAVWSLDDFRQLLSKLDSVFNGSVFPLTDAEYSAISSSHLHDLRLVLRHGALFTAGEMQYSFIDYNFAVLRSETISAIYELFLHVEDRDKARKAGVHYTPAFLADYVLDRVQDVSTLDSYSRVLDPAAGSGIFLVGAYRRIVEDSLPDGTLSQSHAKLHELMTKCIFGVEMNPSACHVAAFSLYLTMLDYVDQTAESEWAATLAGRGVRKVFPPMVGPNIRPIDFFNTSDTELQAMTICVGNPPWTGIDELPNSRAAEYADGAPNERPIGDRQAAELFCWKLLHQHMSQDAVTALLMPAKSFLNSQSVPFVDRLLAHHHVIGITDMSHLRYGLFAHATRPRIMLANAEQSINPPRQVTALLVVEHRQPRADDTTWIYRPLSPSQPLLGKTGVWTIVHDWTCTDWYRSEGLAARSIFRALVASPVDQNILDYIEKRIKRGSLHTLASIENFGLHFKRGDTKQVPSAFAVGSRAGKKSFEANLRFDEGVKGWVAREGAQIVPFPKEQLEVSNRNFHSFLEGNIVLIRRDMTKAAFVISPIAFSDSYIAIAYKPTAIGQSHQAVLRAMAAYLSTRPIRYLSYLMGRRMFSDRRQIELENLRRLPWPFTSIEDSDFLNLATLSPSALEDRVFRGLGIADVYRSAVEEFFGIRLGLRDGQTPPAATRSVVGDSDIVNAYARIVRKKLDPAESAYEVLPWIAPDGQNICLVAHFKPGNAPISDLTAICAERLLSYYRSGASALTHSRFISIDLARRCTVLIKPPENIYWTLDHAFSDADAIVTEIFSRDREGMRA
jgi:hypothetical protein